MKKRRKDVSKVDKTTKPTATKKKLVRVKPYTRTEQLPELGKGVKLPTGYEPAYFRKRKTLAVLRAVDKTGYIVFDVSTGNSIKVLTTKEASQTMSAIRRGEKTLVA
jgi:hypothetical protein